MDDKRTLLLTAADVARRLDLDTCIDAVARAFARLGRGEAAPPALAGVHAADGGFHIKAGLLATDDGVFFAAKTNANFPHNRARHGLPTIQGVVALFDVSNGRLLALMDSIELTARRTAAATAVAARYLARPDAATITIVGAGTQGRVHLRALVRVRPLTTALIVDRDRDAAVRAAAELARDLAIDVRATDDLAGAVRRSDICVTCTPSTAPLLALDAVAAGTFVAGVGADNEHKWELAPDLLAGATLVVDVRDQAAAIGDLHHAIAAGVLTRDAVHAELGEVVAGRRPGRTSAAEITVFDSTGMALQDVAAAAAVYGRALAAGDGAAIDFAA